MIYTIVIFVAGVYFGQEFPQPKLSELIVRVRNLWGTQQSSQQHEQDGTLGTFKIISDYFKNQR